MRDIFKRLLLNVESNDNHEFNNMYRIHQQQHVSGHDRFVFDRNNANQRDPGLNDYSLEDAYRLSNSNINKMTTQQRRPSEIYYYGGFNSDTKLSALGGLSIWQFTAILIASLMIFALFICLVKKLVIYIMGKPSELDESTDGEEDAEMGYERRSYSKSAFRPAYSIDSCDQLIEAHYSTQVKLLPPEFQV